ncbi:MAG: beta strand repeat-containing protein, partial [Phycisphaerales bacterium]
MKKSALINACALVALAGTSAGAQVIDWAAPVDGNWNVAANWTGSNIPDIIGEDAVLGLAGAYTVSLTNSYTIGSLTLSNPLATLEIGNNQTLTLGGDLQNNGTLIVNSPATVFNTHLSFAADATISGNGSIQLIANSAANDAQILPNTFIVTNGAGHLIHGSGKLNGNMQNAGNIIADDPAGAGLLLSGTLTQSAAGIAGADAGIMTLGNGSVTTGGELVTSNGGTIHNQSGVATIGDIINSGDITIAGNNSTIALNGNLNNNGTITINSTNQVFNGHLRFDTGAIIGGSGTVTMISAGSANDAQIYTNGLFTGTIGANQTIEGSGQINGDNDGTIANNGTINANDPNGFSLLLLGNHNGSGGGVYRADDGLLDLGNGLVLDGGTFESTGAGIAERTGNGIATLSNITNNGQMGVRGQGGSITLTGPMTNNGTITLNTDNAVFNAHLRFGATTTLDGSGTVHMQLGGSDLSDAQVFTDGAFVATIGPNQTIDGAGRVDGRSGGTIINNGTINGNDPAFELRLQGNQDGSGGGVYRSDDGVLGLASGLVLNGGTFDSSGSGMVEMTTGGIATLSNITNIGTMGIKGENGIVGLAGPLTNNGTILINSNLNIFNAHIRFLDATIIDGTGTIDMQLGGSSFGDAQILNDQGFVGTIGSGQTITGNGLLQGEMNMDGTLDPGSTFRQFNIDTLHLSPTSGLVADLGGLLAGEFDRVVLGGSDSIDLDGTLTVNLDPGYVPAFGDTWNIIDGGTITGMFAT